MRLAILCNDKAQKKELIADGIFTEHDIYWVQSVKHFEKHIDVFFDLEFVNDITRVNELKQFLPQLVFVNSVENSLNEINAPFIRINAWPTFMQSNILEASCADPKLKIEAEKVFQYLKKEVEWIADVPGFVTPRIICMIINEAYFTLQAGVSSKHEIDIAMKLGTNYPYGPFEWAEKIGLKKILALLEKLSVHQQRYKPCDLLLQEAADKS